MGFGKSVDLPGPEWAASARVVMGLTSYQPVSEIYRPPKNTFCFKHVESRPQAGKMAQQIKVLVTKADEPLQSLELTW